MSAVQVPHAFRLPLLRPDSRRYSTEEDYAQAMRDYQAEFEKRLAAVPAADFENRFVQEEDTDEDDDYLTESDSEDEYDTDDEYEYAYEENPTKPLNYSLRAVTAAELQEKMPDDCCFCLEELTRAQAVTTNCKHAFCESCFNRYQKHTCPCCRQRVTMVTSYYAKASPPTQEKED